MLPPAPGYGHVDLVSREEGGLDSDPRKMKILEVASIVPENVRQIP